ncbi:MAG: helix-turn-helix domain-containing protein [Porticoccaceae bacterium]
MNVKQLSSLLDVSTKTVYCLIKQKKLQTTKVGREYRVPKYELLRYLDIINADNEQAP